MKTTLEQLRAIDNELIIDGNSIMLHDKGEFINYKFGYFTDDVNDDNVRDFYFDNMDEFENDNGGVISSNFPNIVEEDEQEWVKMMKQSNTTDDKLVVVYNIASTLIPIKVTFPTDVIDEGVDYEVDYEVDNGGDWEDIDYSDDEYFVVG